MTWGGTTPGQNGSIGSVELRGFEPLTPSMPYSGRKVDRGHLRRS